MTLLVGFSIDDHVTGRNHIDYIAASVGKGRTKASCEQRTFAMASNMAAEPDSSGARRGHAGRHNTNEQQKIAITSGGLSH
ncbi:hypothetical protein GWI33_004606 [Rhynchophorus ferrugineus]|uniref:Uncharacterized protein n=1 Tax=Rhynchophorus ferrugineus TaxID=354439 RepID=A0A834IUC5_RHYFE|nr:hypothetical protein GWI33_004606 [Rhynchophorus ferrugineus]